jgi:excisionase family DNA binding protein
MLLVEHETQLLTVKEVARLLGLHPVSGVPALPGGELEHFRLGSSPKARVRIPRDAVVRYIADSYKLKGPTP